MCLSGGSHERDQVRRGMKKSFEETKARNWARMRRLSESNQSEGWSSPGVQGTHETIIPERILKDFLIDVVLIGDSSSTRRQHVLCRTELGPRT